MEVDNYIILTDQQLVMLAGEGDFIAFETLFNRYRDGLYKLYMNRTGNHDDTNDLLQETFIKVFLNLERYDNTFTFGQWIYTIARNTFIDFVRKRRDDITIDTSPGAPGSYYVNPASTEATPEERVINSQRGALLEKHMESMSPRYKKLIELRFFKEYSYEEIAAELNIPMGTVKTQIHRAREQLCKLLTDGDVF